MKMQRLLVTALMLGLSIAPMTSAERNDTSSRDPHETDPRLTAHDAVAPGSFLTLDDWSIIGDQPGVEFGYSVATAGDVNGDGYADVIVGAPMYDNGTDNGAFAAGQKLRAQVSGVLRLAGPDIGVRGAGSWVV